MNIQIKTGSIEDAARLTALTPEFKDPIGLDDFQERLKLKNFVVLIALIEGKEAGFSVAYVLDNKYCYAWMGSVLPNFRRLGVMQHLMKHLEQWALDQKLQILKLKTRNKHKNMLAFAAKNNFHIVGFEAKDNVEENRIWLEKQLGTKQ